MKTSDRIFPEADVTAGSRRPGSKYLRVPGSRTIRNTSSAVLQGAVLGVCRGAYDHYGIASRDGGVFHYTSRESDISGDMTIQLTSPQHFLRQADSFWTMSFPDEHEARRRLRARAESVLGRLAPFIPGATASPLILAVLSIGWRAAIERITAGYHLYSPEETLERAFSRLGESRYNVATMNCEHFAFWCRTGLSTSQQVDGFLLGGVSLVSLLIPYLCPKTSMDRVLSEFTSNNGSGALFRKSRRMPASLLCSHADRSPLKARSAAGCRFQSEIPPGFGNTFEQPK